MRHRHLPNIAGAALLSLVFLLVQSPTAIAQNKHTLPLFMSSSHQTLQSFVRIINRSDSDGDVTIYAFDDDGERFGPVTLSLEAEATRHFNSDSLRDGDPEKGLDGSIADGEGNWRLELETELDIAPLAYTRPKGEGFLTSTHDVALSIPGAPSSSSPSTMRWHVPIFNPGGNADQQSRLRVVNISGIDTVVEIEGIDDDGTAGAEVVRFDFPADAALTLSAQELEEGSDDSPFDGQLGDGTGKWQLFVSAGRPILLMSLLRSTSGHMTNLSTVKGDRTIRGGSGPDRLYGGNGDDVLNPGDTNFGELDAVYGSAGNDTIVYSDSGMYGSQELYYTELETGGIRVMVDGAANLATVDKGAAGTDTIVDIANPMNAGGSPPYAGGFSLQGTDFDDVFDVNPADGQWLGIEGEGGNDEFNIGPDGLFTLAYWYAPSVVVVDLSEGKASNDGHGDIDTINGHPFGVNGSDFTDVLRGSDRNESFTGRSGNDTTDGGGGTDTLRFGTLIATVGNLHVDLEAGTATVTWDGNAFSYTLSNIENVVGESGDDTLRGNDDNNEIRGGAGNDTISGGAGDDELYGGDSDDVLNPGDNMDGIDYVYGSSGNDTIIYTDSPANGWQGLDYLELETVGVRVVVNGSTNQATGEKGADGTDTIVDATNQLPYGIGIAGTHNNDIFDVQLGENQYQYVELEGGAGNDTFNLQPGEEGEIGVTYWSASSGVHIDLAAGRAHDDGHGDVDTYNGDVSWVYGSEYADKLIGSDKDESFVGRGGDDVIDGGGGFDRLKFSGRERATSIKVNLEDDTVTGSSRGTTFTYTVSNIERVTGGNVSDTFYGTAGDERFDGRSGDDTFIFDGGHGNDVISDFYNGDNVIILLGMNVSKSQVLGAATDNGDGGSYIDLRPFGGGTITLWYVSPDDVDESDFLL